MIKNKKDIIPLIVTIILILIFLCTDIKIVTIVSGFGILICIVITIYLAFARIDVREDDEDNNDLNLKQNG